MGYPSTHSLSRSHRVLTLVFPRTRPLGDGPRLAAATYCLIAEAERVDESAHTRLNALMDILWYLWQGLIGLGPLIGVYLAYRVGRQQRDFANRQMRLHLFQERFAAYQALQRLLLNWYYGKPPKEKLDEIATTLQKTQFLFPPDSGVFPLVEEASSILGKIGIQETLRDHYLKYDRDSSGAEAELQKLLAQQKECLRKVAEVFEPYLQIEPPAKKFSICEWMQMSG